MLRRFNLCETVAGAWFEGQGLNQISVDHDDKFIRFGPYRLTRYEAMMLRAILAEAAEEMPRRSPYR